MRRYKLAFAGAVLPLAACSSLGEGSDLGVYSLVRVKPTNVGNGSVTVDPPRPWNRQRRFLFFDSVKWVEDWTLNGPYLDGINFVSGLPGGEYLVRQRKSNDRQVPKFRSNMTVTAVLCFFAGLILDTVTRGRREMRRLAYLAFPAPGAQSQV